MNDGQPVAAQGIGGAATLACINISLMGLLAATFVRGPYSSFDQELWYRYGSLALMCLGGVLPAVVLLSPARHNRVIIVAATIWMCAALIIFVRYVFMSGGGV